MKFITSRIVSPHKVKSLMEIMKEEAKIQKSAENSTKKVVKTASSVEKTQSVKKTVKVAEKVEKAKPVVKTASPVKEEKKVAVKAVKKEVKASTKKYSGKLGVVWSKLKSQASLSSEDRSFLLEYFKKYYPADYAEALIAQY